MNSPSQYLTNYYNLEAEHVKDGDQASEIVMSVLADENYSAKVQSMFENYIADRIKIFEGYAPVQAAIARKSEALIRSS